MACITTKRGRRVIDFYDQHGKRRLKTLPQGITKNDARKILQEILEQVEHGTYLPEKKIPPFSEVADLWLEHKKLNLREHTYDSYECHVRKNLKPFFGDTRITRINYDSIIKFITSENKRGASVYHLKKSLVLLNGLMKHAVRQRLIDSNPVPDVEKPKGHSRYKASGEMDILRPDEIRRFLDKAGELRYHTLFMLTIMSGARQGELLALMWSDVDWYNSQLFIRKTFQHGRFYDPKSATSKRKIDLGATILQQLKKWKLACPPSKLDLIFPSDAGTPINKNNMIQRHFEPALRRAGLRRIRFHDLRHTYASLLIDQGEHPKYIQSQMGHSSITVTMDTYGHLMNNVNRESANRLDLAVFEKNGDILETFSKEGKLYGK